MLHNLINIRFPYNSKKDPNYFVYHFGTDPELVLICKSYCIYLRSFIPVVEKEPIMVYFIFYSTTKRFLSTSMLQKLISKHIRSTT